MRNLALMCVLAWAAALTLGGCKAAKDKAAPAVDTSAVVADTVDTVDVATDTVVDATPKMVDINKFPIWVYVPNDSIGIGNKTKSNKLISSKNVTKIELVKIVVETVATEGGAIIYYAPDSLQIKLTLRKDLNRHIMDDFNRMTLETERTELFICCDVKFYEREKVIAAFKTNGHHFYDEENHLLYEYQYLGVDVDYKDLIDKYWDIESGYNRYLTSVRCVADKDGEQ